MRLIDADEIIKETWRVVIMGETVSVISRKDIDNAPTVEAIPIELYEQVRGERDVAVEQLKSLNIELFEKPYLKAITIEFLEKWFGDNYNALTDLEIAWEKENETN